MFILERNGLLGGEEEYHFHKASSLPMDIGDYSGLNPFTPLRNRKTD